MKIPSLLLVLFYLIWSGVAYAQDPSLHENEFNIRDYRTFKYYTKGVKDKQKIRNVLLRHELVKTKGIEYRPVSVPLKNVDNHQELMKTWSALAQKRELFDCEDEVCRILIENNLSTENEVVERRLYVCDVIKTKANIGVPDNCNVLLIEKLPQTIVKTYLKVKATGYPSRGVPDYTIKIFSEDKMDSDALFKILLKEFSDEPYVFNAEIYNSSKFLAISDGRSSPILKGWRERTSITVDALPVKNKTESFFGVTVTTTLYVNKQATAEAKYWSAADRINENLYVATIKSIVLKAIEEYCSELELSLIHI